MQLLQELLQLNEAQWSSEVITKKHPPDGLFASGTTSAIVRWLVGAHDDLKSAMASLNFYVNRAGANLPSDRRVVMNAAKRELTKKFA